MQTIAKAAEALGLDPSWLRLMCRTGRVKGAAKHGRDWMLPPGARVIARRMGRPPGALTGSPRANSAGREKATGRAGK